MSDWKLGYHANCWGPLGGHPVGVTSIKDLFYQTFGSMARAVAEIAAAGYAGVEMFDGNLVEQEGDIPSFRRRLSNSGVQLVAVYSGANFIFADIVEEEFWRIEKAARLAAEAGALHLVVGGGAKRSTGNTDDDYKRLGDALEQVVAISERNGLEAHYHPHLTTMAETPEQVRRVLSLSRIRFCPDTAHLAAAAGDPAQMIAEHFDRISYVHLKGLRRTPFAFTPLDEGDLDLAGIIKVLTDRRFAGWVLTELDAWPSAAEGARRSFTWLRRHLPAA